MRQWKECQLVMCVLQVRKLLSLPLWQFFIGRVVKPGNTVNQARRDSMLLTQSAGKHVQETGESWLILVVLLIG